MAKVGAANPSMIRYPIPPMIHGGSQSAVFHSLFGGGTCLMHPEFDAHEVWQNIDKHKVNLIFITGDAMGRPMLDALIAGNPETGEPYDLSTLYVMASSAALFSPSIQEAVPRTAAQPTVDGTPSEHPRPASVDLPC